MLLQIQNRIFLLEAVSYASIVFPDQNREGKPIELSLVIDGCPVTFHGNQALVAWNAISKNAVSLSPDEYSASAPSSVRKL